MTHFIRIYFVILLAVVAGRVLMHLQGISGDHQTTGVLGLLGVSLLYLCSHIFRMMRLGLLTLDQRDKIFPLVSAHALTVLPSSLLPFKIGEILRLAAFFHVFERRKKALAVWLTERLGDVVVITMFIIGLYLFNINVPPSMRAIFILFSLASLSGIFGLFAVAKIFVYLNRHLVLTSHSSHGLFILRISHWLRCLEMDIIKSTERRLTSFAMFSVLIWTFEIGALSLFIKQSADGKSDFATLFTSGILVSLPGGNSGNQGVTGFGLYQTLSLALLTVVFCVAVWLVSRMKFLRA